MFSAAFSAASRSRFARSANFVRGLLRRAHDAAGLSPGLRESFVGGSIHSVEPQREQHFGARVGSAGNHA